MADVLYADTKARVIAALKTVPGMADTGGVARVLGYEPTSANPPLIYIVLDRFQREKGAGELRMMHPQVIARLVLRWVDWQQAELALDPFVNSIPAAIDTYSADHRADGEALFCPSGQAGFAKIGGTDYRIVDFTITGTEKGSYRNGF